MRSLVVISLFWLGISQHLAAQNCICVPSSYRIVKANGRPTNPVTPPDTVKPPAPSILLEDGSYAYGTTINIQLPQLLSTVATAVEYSWDNGQTWQQGAGATLRNSATLLARTRMGDKVSVNAMRKFTVFYKRVLFVGNSITQHAEAHEIGWHGSWGMAASRGDKDYVSVLMNELKARNVSVEKRIFGGVSFEQNYVNYDFAAIQNDASLVEYLTNTDLIVMRIAENVNDFNVPNQNFEAKYKQLIEVLRKKPNARVICTNSFWPGPNTNNAIKNVVMTKGYDHADLGVLWLDQSNTAKGMFANESVAMHPGDKGMKAIADAIWNVIK